MSSWVTHLCKGFERFFFLRGGLTSRGTFSLVHWSARPARFEIGDRTLDQA